MNKTNKRIPCFPFTQEEQERGLVRIGGHLHCVSETITVETAFHLGSGVAVERVEQTDAGESTRTFYLSVV